MGSAACRAAASGERLPPQTGSRQGGAVRGPSGSLTPAGGGGGRGGRRRQAAGGAHSPGVPYGAHGTTYTGPPARRAGGRGAPLLHPLRAAPAALAARPSGSRAAGGRGDGGSERERGEKSGEEGKEIFALEAHGGSWQYIKGRRLGEGREVPADLKVQSLCLPSRPSAARK